MTAGVHEAIHEVSSSRDEFRSLRDIVPCFGQRGEEADLGLGTSTMKPVLTSAKGKINVVPSWAADKRGKMSPELHSPGFISRLSLQRGRLRAVVASSLANSWYEDSCG